MTERTLLPLTPLGRDESERLREIVQTAARDLWAPYDSAIVHGAEIPLYNVCSLVDMVVTARADSALELVGAYEESDIDIFDPVLAGGRLILPPIIERSNRGDLIIDGGHRLLGSYGLGATAARALIITTPRSLPRYAGKPVPLADISYSDEVVPPRYTRDGLHSPNPLFRPGAQIIQQATNEAYAKLGLRK